MAKKIPVILDVDTGLDDAVAIMLALKCKRLDVKMIVTCHGNTNVKQITKNTLEILNLLGEDVLVFSGLSKPLHTDRAHIFAHGTDGMGGYDMPDTDNTAEDGSAVTATHNLLQESAEPITYICISPASNLGNLLAAYPEDAAKIREAVLMSASNQPVTGDELPYREFNSSVDPEALEVVINSPVKKVFVTMEMGHTSYLDWHDVYRTKHTNTFGCLLEHAFRGYHDGHVKNGIATHDGCAVAYVINPKKFVTVPAKMQVIYYDQYQTGVGVVDYSTTDKNCLVTQSMNTKWFKNLYFRCLRRSKVPKNIVITQPVYETRN